MVLALDGTGSRKRTEERKTTKQCLKLKQIKLDVFISILWSLILYLFIQF